MGPVEQGLLECAANGTLSPEGRVSLWDKSERLQTPPGTVTCPTVPTELKRSGVGSLSHSLTPVLLSA